MAVLTALLTVLLAVTTSAEPSPSPSTSNLPSTTAHQGTTAVMIERTTVSSPLSSSRSEKTSTPLLLTSRSTGHSTSHSTSTSTSSSDSGSITEGPQTSALSPTQSSYIQTTVNEIANGNGTAQVSTPVSSHTENTTGNSTISGSWGPGLEESPGLVAVLCIFCVVVALVFVVVAVQCVQHTRSTSSFERLEDLPLGQVNEQSPFAHFSK